MGKTIHELGAGGAISATDEFEAWQGADPSKRVPASAIKTFVNPIESGSAAGGDLSGTYPNPEVTGAITPSSIQMGAVRLDSGGLATNSSDEDLNLNADGTGRVLVEGVPAIRGANGAVDNAVLRADGTGGVTSQGSSVTLSDTDGTFTNTTANGGFTFTANGTGNTLIASGLLQIGGVSSTHAAFKTNGSGGFVNVRLADDSGWGNLQGALLRVVNDTTVFAGVYSNGVKVASGVAYLFSSSASDANGTPDAQINRAGAADIAFGNGTFGNATATLKFGGGRCRGLTSSAGAASTTEYPSDGDWGLHRNSTSGLTSLVRNDGGTIKSVALA